MTAPTTPGPAAPAAGMPGESATSAPAPPRPPTQPAAPAEPGPPASRHRARWIAGAVLVVAVVLLVVLATRPSYQANEAASPLVGKQAPAITTTTVTGQSFSLASYRGRWVVLNFFSSWCVPCQEEEPNLVAFAFDHRQPGSAAVVGVVFDDTDAAAAAFQAQQGATWPTLTDPRTTIALAYGVTTQPETFLISPTGVVAAHIFGAIPSEQYLDQQLARAERGFG